jgi:hypothetical protein
MNDLLRYLILTLLLGASLSQIACSHLAAGAAGAAVGAAAADDDDDDDDD